MVKRVILGAGMFFLAITSLFSEVDIDTSLSALITAGMVGDEDITSSGLATGLFSVKSVGNKNVKSQLTLDFTSIRSLGTLSISKAFIKFRYPDIRATIGKTRITWGDGAAFNAGDVIFDDYIAPGGEVENVDLTADELKSMNRTMVLLIYPLGRFTFLEGIYLPYDFFSVDDLGLIATGELPEDEELDQHSIGGRFVSKAGGIKLETGYIYNGFSEVHKPYVSFNGTMFLDYHLSASVNITNGETDFDDWDETLKITTGLFYLFDLENDITLTTRLEAQIKPYADWDSDALLLYPEIAFVPNEELSLFVRAIINPLDVSTESSLGLNWRTYQGFTIGSFLTADFVEDEDTELALTIMVTHKF
ncbi:MAG: hypothetical protein OCD02_14515 [Spirochaetaceae bacterium]